MGSMIHFHNCSDPEPKPFRSMMQRVPFFFLLSICILFFHASSKAGGCSDCLPSWDKTKAIIIDNTGNASDLYGHQINVDVNTQTMISNGNLQTDGADLRFMSENCDQLCHSVDEGMNTSNTDIWVKVDTVQGASMDTIYMYYGNSGASDVTDSSCVFDFYEGFEDGNTNGWTDNCIQSGSTCGASTNTGSCSDYCDPTNAVTTQSNNGNNSAKMFAHASCFCSPYNGPINQFTRTISIPNGDYILEFHHKEHLNMHGYCSCSGCTASEIELCIDGSTQYNSSPDCTFDNCNDCEDPWKQGQSSCFNVSGGSTDINFWEQAGDCQENTTWLDDIRIRKCPSPPASVGNTLDPITMNVSTTDPTCNNNDGSITINASGGSTPYQYSNDGGSSFQGSDTFTGLAAGTYTLVAEESGGCSVDTTVTLTGDPVPSDLSFNVTQATCGSNNGEVEITGVTGGSSPYQYDFDGSGFSNSTTYTGLSSGTYTVTVQDANGCTYQKNVSVTAAGAPTIDTLIIADNSCNASCDGSIEIQASGGTTPYQYSIDGGSSFQAGNAFSGLCAGSYDIVVEDDNGCQVTDLVNVNEPAPLSFDTTAIDLACNGDASGEIHYQSVTGGTNPYQYSIDGGSSFQGSASFTGLSAGVYNLVLEDDNGCQASGQIEVQEPAPLSIDAFNSTDASCNGLCDGQANVSVSGGSGTYSYAWSGAIGSSSSTADSICAGSYTLTVQDDSGCTVSNSFTIGEPAPLSITTSSTNADCGGPNGSASVDNVSGGTSPYSYLWEDGQTGSTANGLTPGDYGVEITDDQGCTLTDTITVANNSAQNVSVDSINDATCEGACDGGAYISVSGGSTPYSYQWNDPAGQTSQDATNLCAGTYKVVVTDANGCEDSVQVTVGEPSSVQISTAPDTTICVGGTATLSANASGGTPGYTYHWDNGLGSGQTHSVSPGYDTTYTVYAEDANGCTSAPTTMMVDHHPELQVNTSPDDSICPGGSTQITANGSGGIGSGYSYNWSNGASGSSVSVSPGSSQDFIVTLEDACETPAVKDTITIELNPLPNVDIGGQNLNGCRPVDATLINETPDSLVGTDCVWDFGDGDQALGCDTVEHTYTDPGCHDVTLTVSSPEGCVDSTTRTNFVCVRPYPNADFTFEPEETSVQDPGIDFNNLTTGAIAYEWDFAGLDSSSKENPSYEFPDERAADHQVCLKAENSYGCRDSICKDVKVQGEFILYVPNAFTPDGDGVNDIFRPVVQGADRSDYTFYIYDRWGEVIFRTTDPTEGWDGSVKGSTSASKTDVYVWRLVTKNKYTGKGIERKGHVTVVR